MVLGYVATGVLLPAVAFVQTYIGLAVLRISSWVGRGVRGPPRDALLSDSVQPEQYGKAFGFHRAMDSIGAVIGPTLAFLLLPYLGVRHTILFAIIPGALSILVVVLFIKEAKRGLVSDKAVTFRASISSFPRNFKLLLVAQGTFGIGNFANSLFILAALQILTPSLGEMAAASASLGLYVLLNAVYALASFPVGVLADKRGKAGLLGLGYLFNALACLILAFWINSVMVIGFAFVAVGLQLAFTDTAEAALAAELLPKKVVGTGYGVLQLVDGVGDFASSFVVGLLWVIFSPVVGLVYSALLSVIAWAMILWLMRKPH
jgi:MFS family permease